MQETPPYFRQLEYLWLEQLTASLVVLAGIFARAVCLFEVRSYFTEVAVEVVREA